MTGQQHRATRKKAQYVEGQDLERRGGYEFAEVIRSWWIHTSGSLHDAEQVQRLREWVADLLATRSIGRASVRHTVR